MLYGNLCYCALKEDNMSKKISDRRLKKAEELIYSYIIKDYNYRGTLGSAEGEEMPKDLSSAILYESSFKECVWGESNWDSLSGNGSKFTSCDFFTNKIYNAALQHSMFDNSVFYNCKFEGNNFAYSVFTWSIIKRCPIIGCAFTGTTFNHVTFENTTIAHSNFELCNFQNTKFINTDLSSLALKYAFFRNVSMNNVILPFMQIPYTFGGMQYIFNTSDKIKISTTNKKKPNISIDEYKKTLPELITFFRGHDDYFPLTNCYLADKQYDLAKKTNEEGLLKSAMIGDFRKLYFFCIQATQELNISRKCRSILYKKINENLIDINLINRAEYQEFLHYFPMIKQLMVDNPQNKPTLLLSFHTNIDSHDYKKLGILMKTLDELAEESGVNLDSKHMEIRHNSPNIIDWLPVGEINELLSLLQNTWETISPLLSTALGNAANVATVVTGIYGLHKICKSRKENKLKKDKELFDQTTKCEKVLNSADKSLASDRIEALRLRVDLLQKQQSWQKNKINIQHPSISSTKTVSQNLSKKIEKLKQSDIRIDSLEIQLLDRECDALEQLYNSSFNS